MRFYSKSKSGKSWKKNSMVSLWQELRDIALFYWPSRRIPSCMINFLYGVKPRFIFFIHPRRTEDLYTGFPPSVLLRRILGRKNFLKINRFFFPTIISSIRTPKNVNGLVVSSSLLPQVFLKNKNLAFKEAVRGLQFCLKFLPRGSVVGLGALWPMVTRRGLSLKFLGDKRGITITNGHSGTLLSLFFTVKKIADISDTRMEELKVAILGVGKMGENLAHALYGKVATLTLIDINQRKLDLVEEKLKSVMKETDIQKYVNYENFTGMKEVFRSNHVVVCTTSNIRRIISPRDIPENTIIIDDSRPEAIPRELSGNRVVLEGGLLKINGMIQNYNYGFGFDENVFGCLGEAYMLSADHSKSLKPTLGDINFANFQKMISLCSELDIGVGDFKCKDQIIDNEKIISIIKAKKDLTATIPYKNICWIFKASDAVH